MSAAADRVGLIVAGVQKAGTSALFAHLADLPAIGRSRTKEAHFFDDDDGVDWAAPDYARYHALFPPGAAVWAEATPVYLYWPGALERMHAYDPAMRILVLLRDPVWRAWSHWQMEYARGQETMPFAWCIREGRARMGGRPHRVFSYVERGFYAGQLERLLGLFPRAQVRVVAADALRTDPDGVLRGLAGFVGVAPPSAPVVPRIVHDAARIDYPSRLEPDDIRLLRTLYSGEAERVAALAGWAALPWPVADDAA